MRGRLGLDGEVGIRVEALSTLGATVLTRTTLAGSERLAMRTWELERVSRCARVLRIRSFSEVRRADCALSSSRFCSSECACVRRTIWIRG